MCDYSETIILKFTDFFDGGTAAPAPMEVEDVDVSSTVPETLPEGFFDDPKADAKVINIMSKKIYLLITALPRLCGSVITLSTAARGSLLLTA